MLYGITGELGSPLTNDDHITVLAAVPFLLLPQRLSPRPSFTTLPAPSARPGPLPPVHPFTPVPPAQRPRRHRPAHLHAPTCPCPAVFGACSRIHLLAVPCRPALAPAHTHCRRSLWPRAEVPLAVPVPLPLSAAVPVPLLFSGPPAPG